MHARATEILGQQISLLAASVLLFRHLAKGHIRWTSSVASFFAKLFVDTEERMMTTRSSSGRQADEHQQPPSERNKKNNSANEEEVEDDAKESMLLALSNEILLQILQHLSADDLAEFAMCSQRCRSVRNHESSSLASAVGTIVITASAGNNGEPKSVIDLLSRQW